MFLRVRSTKGWPLQFSFDMFTLFPPPSLSLSLSLSHSHSHTLSLSLLLVKLWMSCHAYIRIFNGALTTPSICWSLCITSLLVHWIPCSHTTCNLPIRDLMHFPPDLLLAHWQWLHFIVTFLRQESGSVLKVPLLACAVNVCLNQHVPAMHCRRKRKRVRELWAIYLFILN